MTPSSLPNEAERLAELLRYNVLDTTNDQDFDEIVQLASFLCDSEIALISLIDDRRQWFKAKVGLTAQETPREIAFCSHAIQGDELFEIPDATEDERFCNNPLVTEDPNIRFYAGQPLRSIAGYKLGTLCVIDRYPRELTESQRFILKILAKQVERLLELKIRVEALDDSYQLIQKQKEALERINQLKDRILAVLVHDLRNPLSALQGVLNLFDDQMITPDVAAQLINSLRQNFTDTQNQIDSVLEWITLQHEGKNVFWKCFSVQSVLEKSLTWVRELAESKKIQLNCIAPSDLWIQSDEKIIELVLRNLLGNAIKFTVTGGQITLFASVENDSKIRLGVTDTGIGIDEITTKKILDQSLRFSSLGTAREKGTGLGLMLCQTYLIEINTSLEVKSQAGKGSTFSFLVDRSLPALPHS